MPFMYANAQEVFEPEHAFLFATMPCRACGEEQREISVPVSNLSQYNQGAFVQDAFPDMPAGDREQLFQSGIGPDCFDKIFSEEER